MTEVREANRNLLGKVCQGKRTHHFVQASIKEGARGEMHVIIGMFPHVHNSSLQVDADTETSVHTNTQLK